MSKGKVKRLLSLGLAVIMTASMIAGCGNSGTAEAPASSAEGTEVETEAGTEAEASTPL